MKNFRHEASTAFRTKKRKYLKYKINALETNCKNKNIRDLLRHINEVMKGYQPRSNLVKYKNYLLADSYNNLKDRRITFASY
jgi:hypothetical protein